MDDLKILAQQYGGYIVGVMAGGLAYLFRVYRGEKFAFMRLAFNLLAAFFVGYLTGKFMPDALNQAARDGLISLSGFLAFPILQILERDGVATLAQKLGIGSAVTPQARQMPPDTVIQNAEEGVQK